MNKLALYKISYGLYIITSRKDNKLNGQIANTVFQITSEPPTIAVSINKTNLTHEYIKESKVFTVSILSTEAPMKFIGTFGFKSGRDIDKFENVNYEIGENGAPIVHDYTMGFVETQVIDSIDVGTHTIFIGKVINCDITKEKEPMTYDFYHKVVKGKAPKTAPTYIN